MVHQMAAVLSSAGVDVLRFERFSDDIESAPLWSKATLPLKPIHSFEAQRAFHNLLRRERPDVVQLHNPYPLISPSIVRTAHRMRVPVLNFIHNYRHVCLGASLRRDEHECRACIETGSNLPAIRYGCYRGSRSQSTIMAFGALVHSRTWQLVDTFVAVSGFVRDRLVEGGIDPLKVVVRYNTIPDPGPASPSGAGSFLFAGRLEQDKGIGLLLDAWRLSGLGDTFALEIAGSGPMAVEVGKAASELPGLRYLGQLDGNEMKAAFGRSSLVITPSIWHEPCPLTVLEALAHGRAVLATEMGGLPELVDEQVGWLSAPKPTALAAALRVAASDPTELMARGHEARRRYEQRFEPVGSVPDLLRLHVDAANRLNQTSQ